ncbi:MAG: hypothetical protein C0614_04005 [Desulfuromonas sp.]|nr:MAG: hypothetical protein C0614_04005 [Desulfuromonas sp.]
MKPIWRYLTTGDLILVVTLALLGLSGLAWVLALPAGARLVVSDGESIIYTAGLDTPGEMDVTGPLGITRLAVDERGVRVLGSPCPLKICMGMGPIRHSNELIACIPNRILVRIEGVSKDGPDYDLLSR